MVIYIYACGKCRTQFMLPMEKSVTFTSACAYEIIPSMIRSFVYKAKEGGHVRIVHNPTGLYIKSLYYTLNLFYCQYIIHFIVNIIYMVNGLVTNIYIPPLKDVS